LKANHYNPNIVHNQELQLLKDSIAKFGWIAPVIINHNGIIIDGFHRVQIAKERDKLVPCLILDLDEREAMIATIIFNRAKGTHVAAKMSDIIKSLIDEHNMTLGDVAAAIGGTEKEIDLLYNSDIFEHKKIKDYEYSDSWEPLTVQKIGNGKYRAMHNGQEVGEAQIYIDGTTASLDSLKIRLDQDYKGFDLAFRKAVIYEAGREGAHLFVAVTREPKSYEKTQLENITAEQWADNPRYFTIRGDIPAGRSKKKRKPAKIAENQG
jgi:hypothetical protein